MVVVALLSVYLVESVDLVSVELVVNCSTIIKSIGSNQTNVTLADGGG